METVQKKNIFFLSPNLFSNVMLPSSENTPVVVPIYNWGGQDFENKIQIEK